MIEIATFSRPSLICTVPEGFPCKGSCGFLIIPGRRYRPGGICDLCADHAERPAEVFPDGPLLQSNFSV